MIFLIPPNACRGEPLVILVAKCCLPVENRLSSAFMEAIRVVLAFFLNLIIAKILVYFPFPRCQGRNFNLFENQLLLFYIGRQMGNR